jgi:hypothetical protein
MAVATTIPRKGALMVKVTVALTKLEKLPVEQLGKRVRANSKIL